MSSFFDTPTAVPNITTVAQIAEMVVMKLPGCANTLIRKTLTDIYREFCMHSDALKTVRKVTLEKDVDVYPLLPIYNTTAIRHVSEVRLNRRRLDPGKDYRLIDGEPLKLCISFRHLPDPEEEIAAARRPELAIGGRKPSVLEIFTVEVPNYGSEDAPDWFIKKYAEAIAAGTIARLAAMTGKAWSDTAVASIEAQKYDGFLNEAKIKSFGGDVSQSGNCHVDVVDTSGVL